MQGRLIPPVGNQIQAFPGEFWRREFPLAANAGLSFIEWIFDSQANPVLSHPNEIVASIKESRVGVHSLCADYFIDRPLNSLDSTIRREASLTLKNLIPACGALGIGRIVLPFVDNSSMANGEEERLTIEAIREVTPLAQQYDVEIHIEADLGPERFSAFLKHFDSERVKVNYDTGNSASLGYSYLQEFEAYGDRIGSVHIKDRVRGGGTVPLGEGDADLPGVFGGLNELDYDGDLVLQVARGREGEELEWAIKWRRFTESLWG